MGCIFSGPQHKASVIEKASHERRRTQHLIQNMVHEEYRLRVDEVYDVGGGKILGTGISGIVRVVRHLQTGNTYAMKTLHLNRIKSKASLADLRNEVQIMSELDHPNIVQLYETFETDDHLFLIMELCTGGELLDKLHHQEGHHYSEQMAAQLIKKMVGALRYCHDHHIAHRDLKLENFLFESESPDAELKLIDFGLSRHYQGNQRMHRPVGTPYYVAPEVLEGSYTQECDMWSIGVIAYMLLSGRPPFYGNDDDETLARVRAGKFAFPASIFDQISPQGKDFIAKLLVVDQAGRMTARAAQEHPWLHCWDRAPQPLSLDIIGSLRNFHQFSTVKRIAMEVVAFTLRPDQVLGLRKEFEKVDVNSNGEITIEELNKALNASGLISPTDLDRIVKDLDIVHHHTGTISWHEFLAATMDASILDEEHIRLAFERIDADRSGFISKENFAELVGVDMTPQEVDRVFGEVDLDGDGRLSYDEFSLMMKGTQAPLSSPPSAAAVALAAAAADIPLDPAAASTAVAAAAAVVAAVATTAAAPAAAASSSSSQEGSKPPPPPPQSRRRPSNNRRGAGPWRGEGHFSPNIFLDPAAAGMNGVNARHTQLHRLRQQFRHFVETASTSPLRHSAATTTTATATTASSSNSSLGSGATGKGSGYHQPSPSHRPHTAAPATSPKVALMVQRNGSGGYHHAAFHP